MFGVAEVQITITMVTNERLKLIVVPATIKNVIQKYRLFNVDYFGTGME
jgi:hypothetical protein